MLLDNGSGVCDNCGQVEQNDSIVVFSKYLDLNAISPVTFLFCRRNGCAKAVRECAPLTAYLQREGELPIPQPEAPEPELEPEVEEVDG